MVKKKEAIGVGIAMRKFIMPERATVTSVEFLGATQTRKLSKPVNVEPGKMYWIACDASMNLTALLVEDPKGKKYLIANDIGKTLRLRKLADVVA